MGFPLPLPALPTYAPAIVVAILFAIATVALIYRVRQTRPFIIYNVFTVFGVVRVIAYGTRAGWSQQANPREITPILYVTNIAQAAGFVIIPLAMYHLLVLWIRLGLRRGNTPPKWENAMLLFLRFVLPLLQIITVVAAVLLLVSMSGGKLDLLNKGMEIRNASWYGFLASDIIYLILVVVYYCYFRLKTMDAKFEHFLIQMFMGILMLIKLIFRTISVKRPATDIINTSEAIMYCLDALPELLVLSLAGGYNLKKLLNGMEQPRKGAKDISPTDTPPNEIMSLEKEGKIEAV